MARSRRNGAQGEQADTQAHQRAGIVAAAVPAAAIAAAACRSSRRPSLTCHPQKMPTLRRYAMSILLSAVQLFLRSSVQVNFKVPLSCTRTKNDM